MVGRESKTGVRASLKTDIRFVRWRMSEPLSLTLRSRLLINSHPIVLKQMLLSSIMARMAGT
jgi:hypothetical protein